MNTATTPASGATASGPAHGAGTAATPRPTSGVPDTEAPDTDTSTGTTGTDHGTTGTAASAASRHRRLDTVACVARWALAVAACLWIALCTAVGPLYWNDSSIADFGLINAVYFLITALITFGIIVALVRWASGVPVFGWHRRHWGKVEREPRRLVPIGVRMWAASWSLSRPGRAARTVAHAVSRTIVRATDRWWKIAIILFLGWLWVPSTLLVAYGSDVRSQIREFSWAWNQWTGLKQPYIGFFSFVPMDIYPTAHYRPAQYSAHVAVWRGGSGFTLPDRK